MWLVLSTSAICNYCCMCAWIIKLHVYFQAVITAWIIIVLFWVAALCTVFFEDKFTAWLIYNLHSAMYSLASSMSGCEEIVGDILTVFWFLMSPLISFQCTIHLLCWLVVYCVNSYWYVYLSVRLQIRIQMMKGNCWRFSYPTCNYSLWILVLFPWHVFHVVRYASVRGVAIAVNEVFVHMDTHPTMARILNLFIGSIPVQIQG